MNHHTNELIVTTVLDERRRQAMPRRDTSMRSGRLARRTGASMVALGTALAAQGRRLQEPAPSAPCAAC